MFCNIEKTPQELTLFLPMLVQIRPVQANQAISSPQASAKVPLSPLLLLLQQPGSLGQCSGGGGGGSRGAQMTHAAMRRKLTLFMWCSEGEFALPTCHPHGGRGNSCCLHGGGSVHCLCGWGSRKPVQCAALELYLVQHGATNCSEVG